MFIAPLLWVTRRVRSVFFALRLHHLLEPSGQSSDLSSGHSAASAQPPNLKLLNTPLEKIAALTGWFEQVCSNHPVRAAIFSSGVFSNFRLGGWAEAAEWPDDVRLGRHGRHRQATRPPPPSRPI
jgi:hypothetical protein